MGANLNENFFKTISDAVSSFQNGLLSHENAFKPELFVNNKNEVVQQSKIKKINL